MGKFTWGNKAKHCWEETFPPRIWIFAEGEGDGIKSRIPFNFCFCFTKTKLLRSYFFIYIYIYNVPKRTERFHDSQTVIQDHAGGLYRPWYSLDFFLCKMGGERYTCCKALSGQPGCRTLRSCCKKVSVMTSRAQSKPEQSLSMILNFKNLWLRFRFSKGKKLRKISHLIWQLLCKRQMLWWIVLNLDVY